MSPELLILLNTLLQFVIQNDIELDEVVTLLKRARAEGRELTAAELDEFQAQAHAAKAKAHEAAERLDA